MKQFQLSDSLIYHFPTGKFLLTTKTGQEEIRLDNLETIVFNYLFENRDRPVSKTELAEQWPTKGTQEHSVNRVLNALRTKLNDPASVSNLLKTKPRKGIQFIGTDVEITSSQSKEEAKSKPYLAYAVILLAIAFGLYSFLAKEDSEPQYAMSSIEDTQVQKNDISASPDDKFVAYSARENITDTRFIRIKNIYTAKYFDIKKPGYQLSNPVWINDNQLLFQQLNNEHCSIQKVSISENNQLLNYSPVVECNPLIKSRGLAAGQKSYFYYSDSKSLNEPMTLYRGNIETGETNQVENQFNLGSGIYRVYTSFNKKWLVTLSTENWFSIDISLFALDELTQPQWQTTINSPLYSVALENHYLSFKNENGGLTTIDLETFEPVVSNVQFSRPIFNPVSTDNGIMLLEGTHYTSNLDIHSTETGKSEAITNIENAYIRQPVLASKDTLFYVSNQTGINQIWKMNLSTKMTRQVTSLTQSYFVKGLAVNAEQTMLAVNTQSGISLLTSNQSDEFAEVHQLKGDKPVFFNNALLFSKYDNQSNAIYQLDLDNFSERVLIPNGYIAKANSKDVFYSKSKQPGIWKFSQDSQDQIILNEFTSTDERTWNVQDDKLHTLINSKLGTLNLATGNSHHLEEVSCSLPIMLNESECLATNSKLSMNRIVKLKRVEKN